ncbi:hypothetical protein CRENBAI_022636 [Crenichthys baileyi]|uniref:Uncharacterized protein n=1 Tax=Crenichthys baileyi TaxID=28760 RepID=A0AAV9RQB5_9TELE
MSLQGWELKSPPGEALSRGDQKTYSSAQALEQQEMELQRRGGADSGLRRRHEERAGGARRTLGRPSRGSPRGLEAKGGGSLAGDGLHALNPLQSLNHRTESTAA